MERGEAPAGAVTPVVAGSPGRRGRFSGWHPRRCAASSADFQIFRFSVPHLPPSGAERTLKNCHPATPPGAGAGPVALPPPCQQKGILWDRLDRSPISPRLPSPPQPSLSDDRGDDSVTSINRSQDCLSFGMG